MMKTILERVIPLTPAQEEIFAASMVDANESISFNESLSWHVRGNVDENRLVQAIEKLIKRHENLRITFSPDGKCSLIAKESTVVFEVTDVTSEDEIELMTKAETTTAFDLLNGPLYRFKLLRKSNGHHIIILSLHHIICDGWSIAILMRDLKLFYENRELTESPSFSKYVLSEIAYIKSPDYQNELAFWKNLFTPIPSAADMPSVSERPKLRNSSSARIDVLIDSVETKKIEAFAKEQKVSLTVALLAFYRWTLSLKTQNTHIGIGIPAAGQSKIGAYDLAGHCVQLLPTYINIDDQIEFREYLKIEKKAMLDAYDHQSVTFGSIVKELNMKKDHSRIPLIPFKFNVDVKLDESEISLDGSIASYETNPRTSEAFEFYINASKDSKGILLETQYNTGLFDEGVCIDFIDSFKHLINKLTENDRLRLQDFRKTDENQSKNSIDGTLMEYDASKYLHEILLEAFRKNPNKIAVKSKNKSYSYKDLSEKASSIAESLLELGVKEGDSVGVCCQRDPDMIASMLGILMLGANYIPMDPSFPQERLGFMVEDTKLKVILTNLDDTSVLAMSDCLVDVRHIEQKTFSGVHLKTPAKDLLAYMIFTSGTTGRPKGVMVQHQAVHNFLLAVAKKIDFSSEESFLAVTTISFDISILEIFLPLVNGASLYLASKHESTDGSSLIDIISEKQITMMQGTPSTWKMMLNSNFSPTSSFRALCGGEAISKQLAHKLSALCQELWNMYGPTEATVWSSCYLLEENCSKILVGKPLANYQYYILDEKKRAVAYGQKGILHIAGDSIAKGYLKKEELTAEKFIDINSKRLYDTGDVARFDNNGNLELFGRNDHQVKIRGYRIELGEIESAVRELKAVSECIVKIYELSEDDKRIVAYVSSKEAVDSKDLRRQLMQGSLASYMIPNIFVAIDRVPLLPNGKVNRHELKSPFIETTPKEHNTASNSWLRKLWENSLSAEVCEDSDFFDLGGHSMLGIQMTAEVNKKYNTQIGLKDLFLNSDFASFARLITNAEDLQSAPAVIPRSSLVEAPLNATQSRMWYLEQLSEDTNIHNLPAAWALNPATDMEQLKKALLKLIANNEVMRLYVDDSEGLPMQRHVDKDHGLKIEEKSFKSRSDAMQYMESRAKQVIDIHAFPMFHLELIEVVGDKTIIYFNPHHMIWDGWSFDLFLKKLGRYYKDLANKEDIELTSYRDYGLWADSQKQTSEYQSQLKYWQNTFTPLPANLDIVTKKKRPHSPSNQAKVLEKEMDVNLVKQIDDFVKANAITDFMFFIACYYLFLTDISKSKDVVIGTPMRGRDLSELEDVLGVFIKVMPLRFKDLDKNDTLDLLKQVKKICVDGFSNSKVSIEDIIASLDTSANTSRNPLFSAMFSYQNVENRTSKIGGYNLEQLHISADIIHADQLLWIKRGKNKLTLCIEVNSDLWDEHDLANFMNDFMQTVKTIISKKSLTASRESDTESAIIEIWKKHLGVTNIESSDNFFNLGGHSLLAISVVAEINKKLSCDIKIRDILTGTVATLALKAKENEDKGKTTMMDRIFKKKK